MEIQHEHTSLLTVQGNNVWEKEMQSISTAEMMIADINSEFFGVSRALLMENAGSKVAEVAKRMAQDLKTHQVVIFAGKGGNGGDGLVAARHLSREFKVHVFLLSEPSKIKSSLTFQNWKILSNLKLSVNLKIVQNRLDIPLEIFNVPTVIIDAIFGTGIRGSIIKEPIASIIDVINAAKKSGSKVISVDTPSGMDPDTGTCANKVVDADKVVCFHRIKRGLVNLGNKLVVANIGIPIEAELFSGPGDFVFLPKRHVWSHKGENGRLLILAGSQYYSGAPALAALAAQSLGIDLVTLIVPENIVTPIRSYSPELIVFPFSKSHFTTSDEKLLSFVFQQMKKNDSVLIGPGIGKDPDTIEFVKQVIHFACEEGIPLVVDADAISAIPHIQIRENTVITPHAGEFQLLSGIKITNTPQHIQKNIELVVEVAKKLNNAVILLKGAWDIITNGMAWKINAAGTALMTRGGTGDILSGLTAALLSIVKNPYRSAVMGAFLNGITGEMTYMKHGFYNDLEHIKMIPFVLREIKNFIEGKESSIPLFNMKTT